MKKWIREIRDIIFKIRDFPKSIYFNYKCLPKEQAKKMPIRVLWNTKLGNLEKGCVKIKADKIEHNMIKIGYHGGQFISKNRSYISIINGGKLVFRGDSIIAEGCNICITGGEVTIGKHFYANRNLQIQCDENISLGDNVLIGWNVKIRDTDGHEVKVDGISRPYKAKIDICDHVWIASDTTILKDSYVSDDCIIACGSVVCGSKFNIKNCLIAGIPARIKKEKISWTK
ncbi:acyltransferase [Clostridium perfringens]|uniref:acyltransferase n=1 Tax=Clostridium perfringens TaxID=1502 RepID=UPI001CAC6F5D|nr:hypothetical protein [Clostridium perfringens]MDK0703830.1 hypothetical protein [Clostridium perfringens]MDM0617946.1 hypothetical protein [Clostridium perfringens]MDZ4973898.1 acyltransferase [Clostridium perfringens]HBI6897062.1 hypothetical protein [Clostridium perfringens]HBI6917953.1 hypothetical protein [Clostridium perfringens]